MCIICAAIPATAAIGAKLNADQLQKDETHRLPILKITGLLVGLLMIASTIYHIFRWQS